MMINHFDPLNKYMPNYYQNVLEMEQLLQAEDRLHFELVEVINKIQRNQFIPLMDESFIKAMEVMINIVSSDTESLEFRRARILNRVNSRPPYNLGFLQSKLDSIYGVGNYVVIIDYDNYTITLESSSLDSDWFREGYLTIMSMKPANMVYIHKPLLNDTITLKDSITMAPAKRFRVGVSRVGIDPLLEIGEYQEVITV